MRKKGFHLLAVLLFGMAFSFAAEFKIDKSHSAVLFSVQHMGLGNTWGRFNDFSGTINFDPNNLSASSLSVTVQVASVDTHQKDRDAHLRNTDVFDAGTYSTMTFSGKGFKALAKGKYEVSGELMIRNVKKPITVVLNEIGKGLHAFAKKPAVGFETEFVIDRKEFGVGQGKVSKGLGDKVRVIVALEAIAK